MEFHTVLFDQGLKLGAGKMLKELTENAGGLYHDLALFVVGDGTETQTP